MSKLLFVASGLSGFICVALGAFGAHGLKGKISPDLLSAFQTGITYQMFHTLALFVLAVLILRLSEVSKVLVMAGYCWMIGIMLFSGSLFALALGGPSWLGPITPIGGLFLIAGWLCLFISALRI